MKKIILVLICIALLVLPCSAMLNVTVESVSQSGISWNWSKDYTLTNLSIDGYQVILFDKTANRFDLTGLNAGEKHSIKIYTSGDNGNNTATTLPNNINNNIDLYILFLLGLVCIIIGVIAEPIIGFGAFIFGVIGLTTSLNNSFIMGSLFSLLIIASIFVVFNKR